MIYEKLHLKEFFPVLDKDGADPTVEVYLPYNMSEMNRQAQKRPCMVICPGGGYVMCSQRESEPIAMHFLPEGYNVFVITYSVAPHRFPTQLCQVAALMELIYENAEKWNCDTEKIAIMGFSAGGHLAAHYSTMFDCKEVREIFPESKSVNASVLCYPVITASAENSHKGSFINLLGHEPSEEEVEYFSCERNVKETTPPAFIWHTSKDDCVPVANSLLYASALADKKVPFELRVYPYGWHGLATCDAETNGELPPRVARSIDWLNAVKGWLKHTFN